MILSFKKFDNLLLYLSLKVGVNFMNSQHLRSLVNGNNAEESVNFRYLQPR